MLRHDQATHRLCSVAAPDSPPARLPCRLRPVRSLQADSAVWEQTPAYCTRLPSHGRSMLQVCKDPFKRSSLHFMPCTCITQNTQNFRMQKMTHRPTTAPDSSHDTPPQFSQGLPPCTQLFSWLTLPALVIACFCSSSAVTAEATRQLASASVPLGWSLRCRSAFVRATTLTQHAYIGR